MVGEFILQVLVLKIGICTRRLLKKNLIIPPVRSEATAVYGVWRVHTLLER